jgi:predicted DNA-binding transcriptional regulator YafY
VAFDPALAEARVFAVLRMSDITVAARPKTPDFERPAGFDVASYMLMPFQYGPRSVEAAVRFTGAAARRAETLTAGQGALAPDGGDAFDWRVAVASEELLAKWIVANGPGIRALSPASLVARVRDGLAEVVRLHG